jgi:predicted Zn-dependent protease
MKFFALVLLFLPAVSAQFPGLGRIKDKIDGANSKTKPATDRAQRAADTFTAWTPEEEQQIGEAAAEKMVAIFGLLDDPALEKYVNLVGLSVAQFASRELPYRFGILDTDIVGAFALPGGYIFITRSALAGMTNEAQLAGTLGHEVEHAAGRHLETEIRSRKTSVWATQEASSRFSTGPALLRQRADALVNDLFNTSLSRSKEDDADEQGTHMAAAAGYAGNGLLQFLRILAAANADPANQRLFGQILSTHPSFEERLAHLSSLPSARTSGKTLEARFRNALGR